MLGTPRGTITVRPPWQHHLAPGSVCSWSARKERCPSTACRTRCCSCTLFAARSLSRCTRPSVWTWTPPCSSAPMTEPTGIQPKYVPLLSQGSSFICCRKGLFCLITDMNSKNTTEEDDCAEQHQDKTSQSGIKHFPLCLVSSSVFSVFISFDCKILCWDHS